VVQFTLFIATYIYILYLSFNFIVVAFTTINSLPNYFQASSRDKDSIATQYPQLPSKSHLFIGQHFIVYFPTSLMQYAGKNG